MKDEIRDNIRRARQSGGAELDDVVVRSVTVKLMDEIPFVADCGEKIEGSVSAMPGARLYVDAVNRGAGAD